MLTLLQYLLFAEHRCCIAKYEEQVDKIPILLNIRFFKEYTVKIYNLMNGSVLIISRSGGKGRDKESKYSHFYNICCRLCREN
jgi:hypothetical protein